MLIAIALYIVLSLAGRWKLYEKAGRKGWEAIIPIYGELVMLKMVNRPWWWIFYLFIPLIGEFIAIGVYWEFLRSFGKTTLLDLVLGVLFAPFYLLYIGFSKKVVYVGPAHESTKNAVQEWSEAKIGKSVV